MQRNWAVEITQIFPNYRNLVCHWHEITAGSRLITVWCFCRWWWDTLTLWSSPDRTLIRKRRNWKSCPSTTPEQSDQSRGSSTSTFFPGAETGDVQLEHCWSQWFREREALTGPKAIHITQLPANWLYTNLDTETGEDGTEVGRELIWLHSLEWTCSSLLQALDTQQSCFPKTLFHFVIQPNVHVFMSLYLVCCFFFFSVFEMIVVTFTGATAGPSGFFYWGLFKDQHSIPVPFSTCVFRIWKLLCSDQSDFMSYMAVWAGACSCHRLQSGFGTWCSDLVHSTQCYIPFYCLLQCLHQGCTPQSSQDPQCLLAPVSLLIWVITFPTLKAVS